MDPHPGNIICMDDGRVGLIDFGQCSFLEKAERKCVAKIVVALRDNDRKGIVDGMKALPPKGFACQNEDDPIVERFAIWAFDRIDISPLLYDEKGGREVHFNVLGFFVTHSLTETPPAYAAVRRVAEMILSATLKFGGKVMCPLSQAWSEIADQVLLEEDDEEEAKGVRKMFSFFKKVRRKSYRHHLADSLDRKRKKALGLDIIEGAIRHTISPKMRADWQRRVKIQVLKDKKAEKKKNSKSFIRVGKG